MMFHTTEPAFTFHPGQGPLLISMPHAGTHLPPALAARLTPEARQVPDTDWHMARLYDFAKAMGASVLVATHSRYVIDLNRPPDNQNLYPGQDTTGLCPVDTFDKTPIYAAGDLPDAAEINARREAIWQPYHQQLQTELQRLRSRFEKVVLWDAHSIRSVLPRFFDGKLTDINLGNADGTSCDAALAQSLLAIGQAADGFSAVLNGRFKGGHITRQYGQPAQGVHAVQLELTQCSYMQESLPFAYLPERVQQIQPHLQRMMAAVLDFALSA
jgi:N-formylglutamate deformylase